MTLSTSTVTLGELASWMTGFNERRQKQDAEFRVDSLTEWLNFKINTYLKQADKADKEKIKAIFEYFRFLGAKTPNFRDAKPLSPKEIGYLSPRTPRPVYLEKPPKDDIPADEERPAASVREKEVKEYETRQVLLESGKKTLLKVREFMLEQGAFDAKAKKFAPLTVALGQKLKVENNDFTFAGIVEDKNSKYNGQPVGQFASGENLYRIFSLKELNVGVMEEFNDTAEKQIEDLAEDIESFCQFENA